MVSSKVAAAGTIYALLGAGPAAAGKRRPSPSTAEGPREENGEENAEKGPLTTKRGGMTYGGAAAAAAANEETRVLGGSDHEQGTASSGSTPSAAAARGEEGERGPEMPSDRVMPRLTPDRRSSTHPHPGSRTAEDCVVGGGGGREKSPCAQGPSREK